MGMIGFDEGHKEAGTIGDVGSDGLSQLAHHLKEGGHETVSINTPLNEFLQSESNLSALVLPFPRQLMNPEECGAVVDFVKNGGGLFVLAEWGDLFGHAENLNEITIPFGIDFQKDRVTDLDDHFTQEVKLGDVVLDTKSIPQFVRIRSFSPHPVTEGVEEVIYFSGCSIKVSDKATSIATTQMSGFGDLDQDLEIDDDEESGELTVAALVEKGGRIVAIGDSNLIANGYLKHGDNERFIRQVFDWIIQ